MTLHALALKNCKDKYCNKCGDLIQPHNALPFVCNGVKYFRGTCRPCDRIYKRERKRIYRAKAVARRLAGETGIPKSEIISNDMLRTKISNAQHGHYYPDPDRVAKGARRVNTDST